MKSNTYFDYAAAEFLKLKTISAMLDTDTRNRLAAGELKLEDTVFFGLVSIAGLGGTSDLITESTTIKKGTINFDKAALPKLQNLILKGVKIGYATHATETDPAMVKYSSAIADVPTALLRATFIVRQNDKVVFERPVADMLTSEAGRGIASDNNTVWVENWRAIVGDRKLDVVLEFPEGQAVPAGNHFFEFRLIGTKTKVK